MTNLTTICKKKTCWHFGLLNKSSLRCKKDLKETNPQHPFPNSVRALWLIHQLHVVYIYIYTYCIYNSIYTWNLFILYFGASTLQKKALSNQNKGQLGSRYIILINKLYLHNSNSIIIPGIPAHRSRKAKQWQDWAPAWILSCSNWAQKKKNGLFNRDV